MIVDPEKSDKTTEPIRQSSRNKRKNSLYSYDYNACQYDISDYDENMDEDLEFDKNPSKRYKKT
jgi:hypothetical protein